MSRVVPRYLVKAIEFPGKEKGREVSYFIREGEFGKRVENRIDERYLIDYPEAEEVRIELCVGLGADGWVGGWILFLPQQRCLIFFPLCPLPFAPVDVHRNYSTSTLAHFARCIEYTYRCWAN